VIELVRHVLGQDAPEVQAVACEGVAKLMLAGMISDESVRPSLPSSLPGGMAVLMLATDPSVAGIAVLLTRDGREPGSPTMPHILPSHLLLLVTTKPAPHALGA
jgi:hypothetical protein